MKVKAIIDAMGGRPYVVRVCGISNSQVSHFFKLNQIPSHWIKLFIALRPELDWPDLLNSVTHEYAAVLSDKALRDVRYARLRNIKRRDIKFSQTLMDGNFPDR
jgi:hypothetical protein